MDHGESTNESGGYQGDPDSSAYWSTQRDRDAQFKSRPSSNSNGSSDAQIVSGSGRNNSLIRMTK